MSSEVSNWFLNLARCPANGSKLTAADEALLARLNAAIVAGQVASSAGEPIDRPVEGGLVDSPPKLLYPIRDGIVSLVVGDSIPLAASNIPETAGNSTP